MNMLPDCVQTVKYSSSRSSLLIISYKIKSDEIFDFAYYEIIKIYFLVYYIVVYHGSANFSTRKYDFLIKNDPVILINNLFFELSIGSRQIWM